MTYISVSFYLFLAVVLVGYYALPLRARWIALLAGSAAFYCLNAPGAVPIFLATMLVAYAGARIIRALLGRSNRAARLALTVSVLLVLAPLLVVKLGPFALGGAVGSLVVPLGVSFYTMQLIAYLVDVYREKIQPERNPLKFALFASFFPQIIQGPIPRYSQLQGQLVQGHRFDERGFVKGLYLILWGFFLKMMIADRGAVIVNAIFDAQGSYGGVFALVGGVLYSVQLYADFLACVTLSQGIAALFGIALVDNFAHPFGATSVSEFWRRWHISLSTWLRDYVYIPLGGSRRGMLRKSVNLVLTFLVSALWHGTGVRFMVWGVMNALYQIVGALISPVRERIYVLLRMPKGDLTRRILQTAGTFFWIMLTLIIFRADTLRAGLRMIGSIFSVHNPWILFDGELLALGLDWREWMLLLASIGVLGAVSAAQNRVHLRDWLLGQHVLLRWGVCFAVIGIIWVFGAYGSDFNAQSFIYGGF